MLMIDTPRKIWRTKVKNRCIPLEYSDEIGDGLFDYTHYGKAVFKPKVDWKSQTHNDVITYNPTFEYSIGLPSTDDPLIGEKVTNFEFSKLTKKKTVSSWSNKIWKRRRSQPSGEFFGVKQSLTFF